MYIKACQNIKLFGLLILLYSTVSYSQTTTVTIDVNWPRWSSENRVRLFDSSNNQIGSTICNPTNCFNGGGTRNDPYSTTVNFTNVPYAPNYYIHIEDSFGDGWNGGASLVTVTVDGIVLVSDSGPNPSSQIITFNVLQNILTITDGQTVNTCNASFFDTGGPIGNYANNEDITYTICPDTPGGKIVADFSTLFDVEPPGATIWDYLNIHDGPSTGSTLIGQFFNTNAPGVITSTDASGCLTFFFHSDNVFNLSGWEATISCNVSNASISIDDVVVNENAGTATFTVAHTGGTTAGSFTIEYSTANNTANTPNDYTGTGSPTPTITFLGTSLSSQTITIPITNDNFAENTETFFVNLSNPSDPAVTIADSQGEGTINDDDTASIAINDITVNEGDGTATFTVTLSGANVSGGFSVPFTFANGTATDPADYTSTGSTASPINFAGNINETQQITIPIIDDTDFEGDHNFFVNLGAASSGLVTITDNQGEATIQDNDAGISIGDLVSINENAGTATFVATHAGANVPGGFTINYATANNTAVAPGDYTVTASPPLLSFSGTSGETQNIIVPIINDVIAETNESFFVNLSSPSSPAVIITDSQGEGTIIDNDLASIAINDVTVNEGNGTATFTVTLSGASVSGGFSIPFTFANGTATDPADYTATGATASPINFVGNINETQQITVPIIDDIAIEGDHNFFVNLGAASNALVTIADTQGEGTIQDNDAGISIGDLVSIGEASGTATFTVTHSGADITGGFTVGYTTADNTANAPGDYTTTSSPPLLSFSGTSGETQTITVPIINDTDTEGNESFFVNLTSVSNVLVTISDNQAEGTIIDDEIPFIITDTVTDNTCSGFFVDSGSFNSRYSNNENITYTLCPDTPGTSLVLNFTSFDVEDNFDFLQVYDGTTTATLIDIYDNGNIPTSVVSTDASGCLTFVFTSDGSVTGEGWTADISCSTVLLSVNDVTVNEAAGTANFTVTLNGNASGPFSVDFRTEDVTAFADSDYTNTTGTLNFAGTNGETRTITVPIINNTFVENTETFFVFLENVSLANVGLIAGTGTITDDVGDTPVSDDVPLTLFDEFNGYFDYALTAGTLRTEDEADDPCAITDASSNVLTTTIPAGSTIEKAYLLWGHSSRAADDVVTFEGQTVTASVVNSANGGGFYGMVADVTTIINGIPDPSSNTYDFTDLVIDNKNFCGGTVVFGGWALYIFYTNPTFPAVSINMYNGFDAAANTTTNYTLSGFYAIGSAGSKTSVLSWEGDVARTGNEVISVTTGAGTTNLLGDGNNSAALQNVFNATIYDDTAVPVFEDTSLFGFDLDTYDISSLIAQGETTATTQIQTGSDLVVLNSVLLKVPSNLITGTVFEDINYPGGTGRNFAASSGLGIEGVTLELYDNLGVLQETTTTNASGDYTFGGMANGSYSVRVVNGAVPSTRGGGAACPTCIPIQTFRRNYATGGNYTDITNEVGGANPAGADVGIGILTGAQTISTVSIVSEGVVDFDFGFNFNTIVNTNESGQGSLEQFIVNSNNLDETGLDIEANGIFNPAAGIDTSIFMIPPTSDPLGRTADTNFTSGYFNINISNSANLSTITGANTHIDGRTQTAYSGDTNTGNVTPAQTNVGISATALPTYSLPEIQIDGSTLGDVLTIQADGVTIRNTAIHSGGNVGIQNSSGSGGSPVVLTENLLGVNADGVLGTRLDRAIRISGSAVTQITNNYISENNSSGITINGGTSTTIQLNTIESNGTTTCADGIELGTGTGVVIQNNLINNTAAIGIEGWQYPGGATINDNTISNSGQNGGICSGVVENNGIRLYGSNSSITSNMITNSGGAGVVITGGNTSGNLISQNSIYANGTSSPSLGIDIDQSTTGNPVGDGVTLNDLNDTDTGPNGSINFPVFESATISGSTMTIVGWSRPGATIEFFLTDISQGTATTGDNQIGVVTQDYGEGQIFLGAATEGSGSDSDATTSLYNDADGNTDNTNRFNFTITLASPAAIGNTITATATVANSTSEFGGSMALTSATIITNRRITYRVRQ